MIEILVAIISGVVLCGILFWYGDSGYNGRHTFVGIIGAFLALCVTLASVLYSFVAWDWFASEHQANIINREYGTNYTQEEVFYAKNVIDTVRQLDRQRIEVNGNLFKKDK